MNTSSLLHVPAQISKGKSLFGTGSVDALCVRDVMVDVPDSDDPGVVGKAAQDQVKSRYGKAWSVDLMLLWECLGLDIVK